MALPEDDDLDGDGVVAPGEQAPMQTTSAPATPATPAAPATPATPTPGAPGAPGASTVPPWLADMRSRQDQRIADWRGGVDAFTGGLGKVFQGDLKGGFGQWNDYATAQQKAFQDKMGERFKMPGGFSHGLFGGMGMHGGMGGSQSMGGPDGAAPGGAGHHGMMGGMGHHYGWGRGHGMPGAPGAPGTGGSQSMGGNTIAPGEPNPAAPGGAAKPAQAGAWWAGGWGGPKGRMSGSKQTKPKAPAATTSAAPATSADDEEDDLP